MARKKPPMRAGFDLGKLQLLQQVYLIIAKRWGIYQGASNMPYKNTQTFTFNFRDAQFLLVHYPNSLASDWYEKVSKSIMIESSGALANPSGLIAAGIYNYAAPWLNWYVERDAAVANGDIRWAELYMHTDKDVEDMILKKARRDGQEKAPWESEVSMESKRWLPRDKNQKPTDEWGDYATLSYQAVVQDLGDKVVEDVDTGVTYFTLTKLGPLMGTEGLINYPLTNIINLSHLWEVPEYRPRYPSTFLM